MTKKQILIGMAVLSVAALPYLRAPRAPIEAASSPDASGELARLRSEVASLRRSVNSVSLQGFKALAADEPAEDRLPVATARDEAVEPSSPPEERALGTPEEVTENLEQHFASESEGAGPMQRHLSAAQEDLRRALGNDSRLESLSCKQTLCKATLSHKDLATYRNYSEAYAGGAHAFRGVSVFDVVSGAEGGPVRSAIYLAESNEQFVAAAQNPEE